MSKLKYAICAGCGKRIERHDADRIEVIHETKRTGITFHFGCWQEKGADKQRSKENKNRE